MTSLIMPVVTPKIVEFKEEIHNLDNIKEEDKEDKEDKEEDVIKPPTINALFRITPKERRKVIKDIFMESRRYVTELYKDDDKSVEEINEEVKKQSDRLLQFYIDIN